MDRPLKVKYLDHDDTKHMAHVFTKRRQRFEYIHAETDREHLSRRGVWIFVLNTLASCLGMPVLFYISFHALRIYSNANVPMQDLLPSLFFGAAITLLVDAWVGFVYDKLVEHHHRKTKAFLTFLGVLGMIASITFLFNVDANTANPKSQFLWAMMGLTISYTFTNTTTFKNSANFAPAHYKRAHIFYAENLIRLVVLFVYVCFPYWLKLATPDCACANVCGNTPQSRNCTQCINACDRSREAAFYYQTTVWFVIIFGILAVACELLIRVRVDEGKHDMHTSFNKRLAEILRNPLFMRSFYVVLLQYFILFGVAFWMNYWLNNETGPTTACTTSWTSSFYFCSKSWLKQLTFLILIVISVFGFLVSLKWNLLKQIMAEWTMLIVIAGVLFTDITFNQTAKYIIIIILVSMFCTTIAANKVLYTEGMFYDEYLSGTSEPYYLSVLHNSAGKFGFFASLAFQIIFLEGKYNIAGAQDKASVGIGFAFIVATLLIYLLNKLMSRYDIDNFDNIQIAIERNHDHDIKIHNLEDPITKQHVKRPVKVHLAGADEDLMALFHNLDPRGDLKLALNGDYAKLKMKALTRMAVFVVTFIVALTLTIVFFDYLNTNWGWFVFFAMLVVVICIYGTYFNFFVWHSAKHLHSLHHKLAHHPAMLKRFKHLAEDHPTSDEESEEEEVEEIVEDIKEKVAYVEDQIINEENRRLIENKDIL